MVDISERSLEQTIEATLLRGGPDAYPTGEGVVVERLEVTRMLPAATESGNRTTMTKSFAPIRSKREKGIRREKGG